MKHFLFRALLVALSGTVVAAPPGANVSGETNTYTVTSIAAETLDLAEPRLPDLSGYTRAAIEAKIRRDKPAVVAVHGIHGQDAMEQFIGSDNNMAEWVRRQHGIPQAIFITGGYINLADLARQLPQHLREVEPGIYLARLPIVVIQGATLHIDAKTRELRLSQEGGAFLVNDGKLFVVGTKVTAWREADNGPARFRKSSEFRPFLISWGGSETYIANSSISSFGYDKAKSYGISISQYPPGQMKKMAREEPGGWIIDSEFVDMWYGFYCYEARDFVIKGNTYRDNIVYGVDPHDRSHGLIIAGNTAHGTKKKHGIIVSREVNDSFIFNNLSYDNKLSGIMLDRASINNVVAYNEVRENHANGIALYESGHNLLWGNRVVNNATQGIYVRNSENVRLYENNIVGNGLSGVFAQIQDLSAGEMRDLELDPYEQKLSITVVGGQLVSNGSGPLSIRSADSVVLHRVEMLQPKKSSGISLGGVLGERQEEILDLLVRQRKAVRIAPRGNLPAARD
ncbi:poly(beta-D-mannuronate) C5 epimerase [Betaproteobacteria bacterium]|nr:poly(beta-D-mannuronate) C5 epimerase [Betaproteobacteria bacterium]GHU03275.1 poly(beta-D-mannuronate) C5 epimerase [Betaproteobacteria bacterium]GHU21782.1 poly(beta-D-mannuronate) C5 epimerase [Betaproteobacteria bacterium]